ncbi:MAG: Type 1 glutamine amidotransferase-like domain-containing protein [Bacillota bacterium]
MGRIVAIGGGELSDSRSKLIHDTIITLSGQKSPRILFIPAASDDSESCWQRFKEYFGAGRYQVEALY